MEKDLRTITTNSINSNSHSNNTFVIYNITGITSLILTIPFIFLLGVIGYRKYRVNVRRRRIAILEKMWMINVKGNTFRQD